jgi:subtilisin-like proprotein convertase family protein
MLVSPEGTAVVLMSGPCGATPIIRSYLTFDDEAAQSMPYGGTCTTGSYKPTSAYHATFPPPAPPRGPTAPFYPRTLSEFRGENPNGTWRLFVHDSFTRHGDGTDHGVILGGFRVFITTESRSVVIPGNMNGAGPATQYPAVESITGMNGSIEDVFVYLHNISHNRPDDLDIVLVAPGGQKVLLMSDACGGIPIPNGTTFRFNHDDPPVPDHGICNTGPGGSGVNFSPTDHAPADSLPAPAPSGPYTSLAALRGTSPNGVWRLYVHDDLTDRSGYLQDFSLSFDLGPQVPDTIAPNTVINSGPGATTRARQARFVFAASEAGVAFQCRLDSKAWASCTSPRTYRRLSVGQHQVRVRATDAAGNRDASPATWQWRIRR